MINTYYELIEEYLLYFIFLAPFLTQLGIPIGLTFFLMLQGSLTQSYLYFFNLSLTLAIILLVADLIAYFLGYRYGEKILNLKIAQNKKAQHSISYVKKTVEERFLIILFLSRTILLGIAFLTNYIFGIKKMPLKKLLLPLFIAEFIYASIFVGIGFFFKDMWEYLFTIINEFFQILLLLIVLYIIIKSIYNSTLRKKSPYSQK